MADFQSILDERLSARRQQNLYRQRQVISSAQDIRISINGKSYLNFCSNDYLGLANHPALSKRQIKAIAHFGCGSGASHLISGHTEAHHALECELAEFLNVEQVLLFSTGYMANLGTINALLERHDALFQDRLNHASLIDAGQLSRAKQHRYRHNDMHQLESLLTKSDARLKLIASDAVFSMDGDLAPIHELVKLAKQSQAWVMLDDAHGFGVLGKNGRGSLEHLGLSTSDIPIYMATLGKALGGAGAFVAGKASLIEALVQFSRPYIYTTAMPASIAEALRESLGLLAKEAWRRDKLNENIRQLKQGVKAIGLELMPSDTAIQPLLIGDSAKALKIANALKQYGFLISAIRPPTVPENTARLRITLSANHEPKDIAQLLEALKGLSDELILSKD